MNKQSFQEVEECANDRLKEELLLDLVGILKRSREAEGLLTLGQLARAIQEGVGDDDATLAGLLMTISHERMSKESKQAVRRVADRLHQLTANL